MLRQVFVLLEKVNASMADVAEGLEGKLNVPPCIPENATCRSINRYIDFKYY